MSTYARLLAKSAASADKPLPGESLQGHIAEVVKAARVLADARAKASLAALGFPLDLEPRVRRILLLAAFMHDLGKCSEHFQELVRGKPKTQLIRHEAISLWLCWPGQSLAAWLRPAVESDVDFVIAVIAAAAHHRKFWDNAFAPDGNGGEVKLLCAHSDFQHTLRFACKLFDLDVPPIKNDIVLEDSVFASAPPRKLFQKWHMESDELFSTNTKARKLLALVKVLLICADVAGSAIPKAGADLEWLKEQFRDEDLHNELNHVIEQRLEGRARRPFQVLVGSSRAPMTLVKAGCGTGKTVAAFAWAAEQHSRRRLWLTYPTTGTATEGFRDYVDPSALHGKLIHGRAEIDIELFGLRDKREDDGQRDVARLGAIRDWGLDVVTCTVDTVLGLVQNNRRGVYAWPNIAQGAVVFDEIHAYDDKLFGALLRFLEALPGVPALLMTASLPVFRANALEDLCLRVHGCSLHRIDGPEDLEGLPRYRWHDPIASKEDALAEIARTRETRGKVLWVSNTVDRAVSAGSASGTLGKTILYHSRYRYVDRVERHGEVIDAFNPQKNTEFVIACTTQVAEMSLDLSADLLITDLAPIPAMIQRLGRLNRRSHPDAVAPVKRFLVLRPSHELPYAQPQLHEAEQWLNELRGRDLNQTDLVAAWKQSARDVALACESAWLDGGFRTQSAELREASPGITVIRQEDVEDVRTGRRKPMEVAIPMNQPPRGMNWHQWSRNKETGYLPICPGTALMYHSKEGARWVK